MFSYFWERVSVSGGGAESEGGRGSKQDAELELTDCEVMTWDELGCLTYLAIQVPPESETLKKQTNKQNSM